MMEDEDREGGKWKKERKGEESEVLGGMGG